MEINFCNNCDNMTYIYSDLESNTLYNLCKSCGNKEICDNKSKCIYKLSKTIIDKSILLNDNPYITHDITLPIIKDNKNIKCNNPDCTSEKINITYIKYDNINMKYLYICNECGFKWTNNL